MAQRELNRRNRAGLSISSGSPDSAHSRAVEKASLKE
jgi:hypothetical protein